MQSTSIPEICKGEGDGNEELSTKVPWLVINEIKLVLP
ncbi:hypothetical protein SynBIOSU31_00770 [Synechococcus sp. BIOS-U3-1]|nr:hypothetical protein SynBIOSU31_00770 [Synechococcus sp. BIOS-U3-1]